MHAFVCTSDCVFAFVLHSSEQTRHQNACSVFRDTMVSVALACSVSNFDKFVYFSRRCRQMHCADFKYEYSVTLSTDFVDP